MFRIIAIIVVLMIVPAPWAIAADIPQMPLFYEVSQDRQNICLTILIKNQADNLAKGYTLNRASQDETITLFEDRVFDTEEALDSEEICDEFDVCRKKYLFLVTDTCVPVGQTTYTISNEEIGSNTADVYVSDSGVDCEDSLSDACSDIEGFPEEDEEQGQTGCGCGLADDNSAVPTIAGIVVIALAFLAWSLRRKKRSVQ